VCTDGGVVTALLHCLLEKKVIDGSVVSKKTTHFGREPMIAATYEEVLHAAGSRFSAGSGVEELSRFSTYSPTMYAVKQIGNSDLIKIAVVGTPCQAHTLRKMQSLCVVPSHVVKLVFGLFCFENFSFEAAKKKEVEETIGTNLDDIEKLNIRENFIIKLKHGEEKHIPLEKMEKFARPACLACTDFTNVYADISFGGLGSPEGWTTVMIRTEAGERVYQEALYHRYIEELTDREEEPDKDYTAIQQKLIDISMTKRDRAQKNKEGAK
jgi:coenzyme F420 hydrogenase subunit beta